MKRILLIITALMSLLVVNAQEDIEMSVHHVSYFESENKLRYLTTLELWNHGEDTLCLWIEDSLKGNMSIENLMVKYFYGPTYYESLGALMNESNVSFSACKIGSTFFKMLTPHESFSFAFICDQDNTEYVRKFVDEHLIIYKAKYLLPYNSHNRIEYPLKQIVLSCQ